MTSKPNKESRKPSAGVIKLNPRLREAFDNFCAAWIDTMDDLTAKERAVLDKITARKMSNVLKTRKPPKSRPKRRRRR